MASPNNNHYEKTVCEYMMTHISRIVLYSWLFAIIICINIAYGCDIGCVNCNGSGDQCTQCASNYYLYDQKTCNPCPFKCTNCSPNGYCTICENGYYTTDGVCTACPSHCASCTSLSYCHTCESGYYGTTCQHNCSFCQGSLCNKDECTNACKAGYFYEHSGCNPCRSTCLSCSYFHQCNQCLPGKWGITCQDNCYVQNCKKNTCSITTGLCDNGCIDGYYLELGYCYQCHLRCSKCYGSNYRTCTKCTEGYTLTGSTCYINCPAECSECLFPTVCASCPAGYVLSGNTCSIQCPVDCATCSSSNVCTSCILGYVLSENACSIQCHVGCAACSSSNICESCTTGYVLSGNTCSIQCPVDCATCSSSNVCTSCILGYVLSENACSIQCPVGCAACSSSNICESCTTGYVLSGNTCSIQCPVGCATCSSLKVCTSCILGYVLSENACSIQCPVGCATCSSSNVCTSCILGYVLSENACSIQCPVGCATCTSSSLCQICDDNLFGPTCSDSCSPSCLKCVNKDYCTACMPGKYSFSSLHTDCGCAASECKINGSGNMCRSCHETGWFPYMAGCCPCSDGCLNRECDSGTGLCDPCKHTYYGKWCERECSANCIHPGNNGTVCSHIDGFCIYGCKDGYTGLTCSQAPKAELAVDGGGNNNVAIYTGVGGALGTFVVMSIVLVIVIRCIRRQNNSTSNQEFPGIPITDMHIPGNGTSSEYEQVDDMSHDSSRCYDNTRAVDTHNTATDQGNDDGDISKYEDLTDRVATENQYSSVVQQPYENMKI